MKKLPGLDQIAAFLAVAEELSFRRAAERLAIDHSALSRRIKEVEARVGCRLLERTTHEVRVTEAGQSFYNSNRRLVADLGGSIEIAGRIARGAIGELRVAYMTFAAVEILPAAIKQYRTRFPEVVVQLTYQPTQQQKLALGQDGIDLALMLGPFEHSDYSTRAIARERLVAVMAKEHPLARKFRISVDDIAQSEIVIGTDAQWDHYRDVLFEILAAKGREPRIAMEAPSLTAILGLVKAGLGITLVPDVMTSFCPTGLVSRPVADAEREITTLAVWRKPGDKKVLDFVSLLGDPPVEPSPSKRTRS